MSSIKNTTLLILVALIQFSAFLPQQVSAQKMKKIKQSDLGVHYQLPKDWDLDRFGGYDWEVGSAVCDCAGTINGSDRFTDNPIMMIIYPAESEELRDAKKRQMAWDLVFDPDGTTSQIKTENLTFEKTVSKWKEGADEPYDKVEVWQLKTQAEGQYYMIYFWAKPEVMLEREAEITLILESFTPVRILYPERMKKMKQSKLGAKYDLPMSWEFETFGQKDWEAPSLDLDSSQYAGSLNTGSYGSDNEICMLLLPTLFKDSVNAQKRLWFRNMRFDLNGTKTEIKTSKLVFEKTVSTWIKGSGFDYEGSEVWRLTTQTKGQYYVIYFWAKPRVMKLSEETILKILESFAPIKV